MIARRLKKIARVGCALALCSALPMIAARGGAQARWVVKVGMLERAGAPLSLAVEALGAAIDGVAPGRFAVKRLPDGVLSRTTPALERLQTGEVHAYAARFDELASALPEVGALAAPFLFDNRKEAEGALRRSVGAAIRDAASAKGMRLVSIAPCEMRALLTESAALPAPKELSGMRFRGPRTPDAAQLAQVLGLAPATETEGAQLVDGTLAALAGSEALLAARHLTLTDHAFECGALVVSQRWIDGLPAEMRKKIEAIPARLSDGAEKALDAQRTRLLESMKARGVEVHTLEPRERRAFVTATKAARQALEGEPGSIARRIVRGAQAQ
jgi:TRAP-type C4-dicarboxylate transport system substrate-binding protein